MSDNQSRYRRSTCPRSRWIPCHNPCHRRRQPASTACSHTRWPCRLRRTSEGSCRCRRDSCHHSHWTPCHSSGHCTRRPAQRACTHTGSASHHHHRSCSPSTYRKHTFRRIHPGPCRSPCPRRPWTSVWDCIQCRDHRHWGRPRHRTSAPPGKSHSGASLRSRRGPSHSSVRAPHTSRADTDRRVSPNGRRRPRRTVRHSRHRDHCIARQERCTEWTNCLPHTAGWNRRTCHWGPHKKTAACRGPGRGCCR